MFMRILSYLYYNDNDNERISRAPFHMKHGQLR